VKFTNFALLHITVSFGFGILLANYFEPNQTFCFYSLALVLLLFFISFILYKSSDKENTLLFSSITMLCFIAFGALNFTLHSTKNHQSHYSFASEDNDVKQLQITQILKDNKFYMKYYADVMSIDTKQTSGTVLLQLKKDSSILLKPDDYLLTSAEFSEIKSALNPGQFNYKNYLKHKGVYHQMYLDNSNFIKLKNPSKTYKGLNAELIAKINSKLQGYNFKADELAIINALVLGQKQDISSEIYNSYTDSGAIHILAVSGLHVGIILLIITFLLQPFKRFKHGGFIIMLSSIVLLWLYAYLTGLSPSVIRAATMFSMVSIAINLKRKTNTYNTLIGSIFIILLFKPQFLFDVGFQLSYAAVFSIVAFQPLIAKLWHPKYKLVNIYWQTFTVTLSAQFGVIPLSVFYFHQIPGLFWLSNLIIIPLLPFILGLAILVIVFVLSFDKTLITSLLASALSYTIAGMNYLLKWISSIESFVFKDLSFSVLNLATSIVFVVSIYLLWKHFSVKRIYFTLFSILLVQISFLVSKYESSGNELVVFHRSKHRMITVKNQRTLTIYNDSLKPNYITTNYKVKQNITNVSYESIPSFISFNEKLILVIDSLGLYTKQVKPDIVILTQSPQLNLDRLIDDIKPEIIIGDGSNYKSYIKSWNETCKQKKVLFHSTEKGAFILNDD
tara:strand:+ start:1126 stop:3147 length:2022 start_codon:yes stop_codon:yes gene_type:complete